MAIFKPSIPGTAQHFLECDTEDCETNCEFYCNSCHQRMCNQCRNQHLKGAENKNHHVVLYQQRKRRLPVEKCKIHQTKKINILCVECNIPLCSKCTTVQDHRGHKFVGLETIYAEKFTLCQERIYKIHEYFLPTSQDLQREIKRDETEIKKIMESIRTSMKVEAESLKNTVDKVLAENTEILNKIEYTMNEKLKNQGQMFTDYMNYLNDLVKKFQGFLSSTELTILIPEISEENLKIRNIPETSKPAIPVFTAGQYSKDDVSKLFGKISVKEAREEMRKIKPMEGFPSSASAKSTRKQSEQDRYMKSDVTKTISLSSCVTKVREFNLLGVCSACHISLDQSGRLWVSDYSGNLVQTDREGNQLQRVRTSGGHGYHTVTEEGDLIFTDQTNKLIKRIEMNNKISTFFTTGDWKPVSIYFSHINGDILVGMINYGKEEAKVARYNKAGTETQNIQRDDKGQKLFSEPRCITENINGDICISDYPKEAVVVVNKSGQHRFSYTGQESSIWPYGICTDILGHILVCDGFSNRVHLLDQDGQFLSYLLSKQQRVESPRSVCADDDNNVYVGQLTNTVKVFKYLQ
ncbi:uncharacterized protein LOC133184660 [Saccostrea echinata]|uniref:uncharacterized protein LOC133184660 n=1 Tax=Saccostrea echinata TaxID=191078 RepID=UPI002A82D46B|nr:uncharacterized protein LOC133184660 [Saccostrea echinata]